MGSISIIKNKVSGDAAPAQPPIIGHFQDSPVTAAAVTIGSITKTQKYCELNSMASIAPAVQQPIKATATADRLTKNPARCNFVMRLFYHKPARQSHGNRISSGMASSLRPTPYALKNVTSNY